LKPKWPDVALKRQAKHGVVNETEELMNTTLKTKLAIVAAFAFVATASAFYNSEVGRWLSRDPIGERGGENVMAFVHNHPTIAYDALGQQCCLITVSPGEYTGPMGPDKSKFGHSILKCDNGAYVSLWPEDEPYPSWDEKSDNSVYSGATKTTTCFSCLDETKVRQWIDANKGTLKWSKSYNCADAAIAAMAAGLPDDKNKKPDCKCAAWWQNAAGYFSYVEDLLNPSGLKYPGSAAAALDQLTKNRCNRYKCTQYTAKPSPSFGL
jgi:hypothetical protein